MPRTKMSRRQTNRRRPNLTRAIQRVLNKNTETKFFLNDLNGAPASDFSSDLPLTVSLNAVGGGTGAGQRVGN